jgi:hypothetical protein
VPRNQGGSDDLSNLQAPLLPLQCRQAMGGARRERIAERMIGAAEHVRNSMLGSGQRTNRDEILIANRSETAA